MITAYGTVENAVRGDAGGSGELRPEALGQRKTARRRARRRRVAARGRRKRSTQARPEAALQLRKHRGQERAHAKIFDLVAQVAPSRSTVLLQGESGTGKEVIAKAIHLNSPRRDRPFVPVNTGSMPTDLLESTLFGHVKGAFTSAIASKKGLFEIADKGTLFLDEIGTMGMDTQAKILRVSARPEVHAPGRCAGIAGGCSHHCRHQRRFARSMVREGKFREDLFYRLNVITIELPPLRQRKEDIPLLVNFFLERYSQENERPLRRITPEALRPLMAYSWPGNVRELENVIERAVVFSSGTEIKSDCFPTRSAGRGTAFPCWSIGRMRPCSTSWKIASATSSWTCSKSATGTRLRPPNASTYRFPHLTRKSNG